MASLPDAFYTITALATGEFKDRGSKFFGYAFPVTTEAEALEHLEALRKEHFKARHHCYAWRFGVEGTRFRANDDGEPSGTAGRPILGQIDAAGLTDVLVVVVRYFGGTLLGTSGLINAYREGAAEALGAAEKVEKIIKSHFILDFDYALMPDIMQAVKKMELDIVREAFSERGLMEIGIRNSEVDETLLDIRAQLWKVSKEEALLLEWPAGLKIQPSNDAGHGA
ncbi:MAG: YigZ family protein [Lewinellaceae bacterium]|nr:YigZ family protein [Lewinellaceae bacterium]